MMGPFDHVDALDPTENIEKGLSNLDRFGITVHSNFISEKQVKDLRDCLEKQAELERDLGIATFAYAASDCSNGAIVGTGAQLHVGRPSAPPPLQPVLMLVNKGRAFIELAKHPLALAYAREVLRGSEFYVGSQTGIILRRGGPPQAIHSDQQYLPFNTPTPVSLNIMVALGDYDEDMGATRVVPGSHTQGPPDMSLDPGTITTVPLVMKPGYAALWESRVWHGQGASSSDKPRYSISTMYQLRFLRAPKGHRPPVLEPVYETLSPEERALYDYGD